jgi:hypothetical protein
MSPRRKWAPPLPHGTKGRVYTRLRLRGWGESQLRRLKEKLTSDPATLPAGGVEAVTHTLAKYVIELSLCDYFTFFLAISCYI